MKNMKRYKQFIIENNYQYQEFRYKNKTRGREVTEDEFWELFKNNCKNFNIENTQLWRNTDYNGDYYYIDPTKSKRRSIEDVHIHSFLLDNLPEWKKFPKRSSSIIASTKKDIGGFGNSSYFIIPYDDVPISVCPYGDIWISIGERGSIISNYNNSLKEPAKYEFFGHGINSFFKTFDKFLCNIGIDVYMDTNNEYTVTYDEFKYFILNKFNPKENENQKKAIENNRKIFDLIKYSMNINKPEELTGDILMKFISKIFSPDLNGFNLLKYERGFKIDRKEVALWIGGPCLMVEKRAYENFLSKLN